MVDVIETDRDNYCRNTKIEICLEFLEQDTSDALKRNTTTLCSTFLCLFVCFLLTGISTLSVFKSVAEAATNSENIIFHMSDLQRVRES